MLQDELKGVVSSELEPEVLPLTLFNFFNKRSEQLLRKKYLYALRWSRYCYSSRMIEKYQAIYKERIDFITKEYEDCTARCRRLSEVVRVFEGKEKLSDFNVDTSDGASVPRTDSYFSQLLESVETEDISIYMKFLMHHSRSSRRLHAFFKLFQWIPSSHRYILGCSIYDDLQNITSDDIYSSSSTGIKITTEIEPTVQPIKEVLSEVVESEVEKKESESKQNNDLDTEAESNGSGETDHKEKGLETDDTEESEWDSENDFSSSLPGCIYYFEDLKPVIGSLSMHFILK